MWDKIFLSLFLVLFILLIGCSQTNISVASKAQQPNTATGNCAFEGSSRQDAGFSKVSLPLLNKLCFLEKPLLNKPVKIIYKFKYDRGYTDRPLDTVDGTANIILPKKFSLIYGNLEWKGKLIEKEEKEIEVTVKATENGYQQVGASMSAQGIGTNGDVIYLNITQDKTDFLNNDEWLRKEGTIESATAEIK